MRIKLQGLLQVGFSSGEIVAQPFHGSTQTQVLHALLALNLDLGQLLLRDVELLPDGSIVIQVAVSIDQVQPQLCGIENALSRPLRHGGERGQVFADCVIVTALDFRQVGANRVQAVVIGIKLLGSGQISARLIQIADA